jgi:lysophospholipase L1-like esterase
LRESTSLGDNETMTPPHFRPAFRFTPVVLAFLLGAFAPTAPAEILVKSGEKVAFMGDSITAQGWGNAAGYVKLIVAGLAANGVDVTPIPAGISGHKSNDMLARLDHDVLSKKPQWMTLSCGVNDVWHGKRGVPLDDSQAAAQPYDKNNPKEPDKGTYEKNITQIVDQAQAAGAKVIILTATVIQEDLGNADNQRLAPYNDFLRHLAKEKNLPLADLNNMFQEKIKAANQPGKKVFTVDGVHMNTEGNKIMATGVLQAFGLDAAQIKKAQEAWEPLVAQAEDNAKKAAEAKARAAAEKAAAAAAATPVPK